MSFGNSVVVHANVDLTGATYFPLSVSGERGQITLQLLFGSGANGNLIQFDSRGLPVDSGKAPSAFQASGTYVTAAAAAAFSGAYSFTGTLTGATTVTFPTSGTLLAAGSSPESATFSLPGSQVVGANIASTPFICDRAGTFVKAWVGAFTGPTGSALIYDVLKSSNQGSTWTSLWATNTGNRPQIAASAVSGTQTSFDTTTFAAGDWLQISCVQVGSTVAGANVTVKLSLQE